ncbi:tetratricopeptide repeat protein [Streptomyces sp. NPDC006367]|uniref:tetratricopeptide repeat protein n=1 Tax=unclassified Streptomyces TaxID=2593676 RepID=UPI00339E5602
MSRLGRDEQRDQQRAERPVHVRLPEAGGDTDGAWGDGAWGDGAWVDGAWVVAAPGEEIRHAVLDRLHRFARTAGRPVLATVHDERIGCVVRLRVDPDGSSHLAGKPVPTPRGARSAEDTPAAGAPAEAGPQRVPSGESVPTPAPLRGFDAVAEAVLEDAPLTAPGDAGAPALLAEPTARINDAIRQGRTREADRLAERAVAEASATLGPEHPEVLRLRELTAYIAYLSGDPGRAFRLSLDLAGIHRRAGDAEAAYGNVQSAATAWRAVRDPEQGLELGRDLVGLWGELAAEAGPAAEDAGRLESARTRMGRLAERARAHARAD